MYFYTYVCTSIEMESPVYWLLRAFCLHATYYVLHSIIPVAQVAAKHSCRVQKSRGRLK